jgi:hypothetical protein
MAADRHEPPARRVPMSELTLAVALIIAIDGLVSIGTPGGLRAMIVALILGLLAGLEIRYRERPDPDVDDDD